MDNAPGVRVAERIGDFDQQPNRFVHGQLALTGQPLPQRLSLDVGHDVVEEPVGAARIEDAEDVGMLEPGRDLDLLSEPIGAEGGRQVGAQHLDRHLAVVLEVLGEIDRGHPARAEFPLDSVAVGQGCSETINSAHGWRRRVIGIAGFRAEARGQGQFVGKTSRTWSANALTSASGGCLTISSNRFTGMLMAARVLATGAAERRGAWVSAMTAESARQVKLEMGPPSTRFSNVSNKRYWSCLILSIV